MQLQHTTRKTPAPAAPKSASERLGVDPDLRQGMIAQAAYFKAKHRGFRPGHELQDWLAAEAEVDSALCIGPARPRH